MIESWDYASNKMTNTCAHACVETVMSELGEISVAIRLVDCTGMDSTRGVANPPVER